MSHSPSVLNVAPKQLMQGNEALARGLVESGCVVAASYPGTPASEILSAIRALQESEGLEMHVEWAVNEKVAFEIAYAASQTGLRAVTAMKQVGLNVASDPLASAAYLGTAGGFVVVSADDPGPNSSQTEQDSRLSAMLFKVPVLDPASPAEAKALAGTAFELSEAFGVPVMIRPTTRVCHACQDVAAGEIASLGRTADFRKDPTRWAATPVYRYNLHLELNDKLARIAEYAPTAPRLLNPRALEAAPAPRRAVVASGAAAAYARECIGFLGLEETVPLYQVVQPFPLHAAFIRDVLSRFDEILVLEETVGVVEMQLRDRNKVRGKESGAVPAAGELLPEIVERILAGFAGLPEPAAPQAPAGGGRRPTLCPGCPHRASFYAVKKAAPAGIYPSDIGCYTLGANLGGVDTVLCMGAAVGQAAGFYQAYRVTGQQRDIVATVGDSTFFHACVPPLVDAVTQGARFVLAILDNGTTAMTGNQPTPAHGSPAGRAGSIEALVAGCGVQFIRTADPLDLPAFIREMKAAVAFARTGGVAVVIARSPCLLDRDAPRKKRAQAVVDAARCTGCRACVKQFECPALVYDTERKKVAVDIMTCSGCAVCFEVCPARAIGPGRRER
jgi:indolepyruvate ferredoxin oxidoreductase alpha subunit